jgi:hypothetical protein
MVDEIGLQKNVIHRVAEPPPDLDEFEADIMASYAAHTFSIYRAWMRALLRYVRRLEREVGRASGCAAATPATPATLF